MNAEIAKVGEAWRVVIPPKVRDTLNLQKGDYLGFSVERGIVVLRKVIFKEVEPGELDEYRNHGDGD